MMRGQAFRYLGWQFLDWAGPRLLASLAISFALSWTARRAMGDTPPAEPQLRMIIAQLHMQLAFIFTLLFLHGIVSVDRNQGYYRFYMAKPVSPVWFYGQGLVLALLGTLAASVGYVVSTSLLISPLWVWSVVPQALVMFAIFGMLMFALNMVTKLDWLGAIAVVFVSSFLRHYWPASQSRLGKVLEAVLPPNQLIGSTVHPTTGQWFWIAGWGIGLFALGLLILWRRPLGEN
jgi:hypothetical protein